MSRADPGRAEPTGGQPYGAGGGPPASGGTSRERRAISPPTGGPSPANCGGAFAIGGGPSPARRSSAVAGRSEPLWRRGPPASGKRPLVAPQMPANRRASSGAFSRSHGGPIGLAATRPRPPPRSLRPTGTRSGPSEGPRRLEGRDVAQGGLLVSPTAGEWMAFLDAERNAARDTVFRLRTFLSGAGATSRAR